MNAAAVAFGIVSAIAVAAIVTVVVLVVRNRQRINEIRRVLDADPDPAAPAPPTRTPMVPSFRAPTPGWYTFINWSVTPAGQQAPTAPVNEMLPALPADVVIPDYIDDLIGYFGGTESYDQAADDE